jgi:predicted nucleic acid-binding protein
MKSFGSAVECLIDSSVLFKLIVDETGSSNALLIAQNISRTIVSPITRIETHSALRRASQRLKIPKLMVARLGLQVDDYCDSATTVAFSESLQGVAVDLTKTYKKLRSLDAIQLASAICAQTTFIATADTELMNAAQKEGLHVLNPMRGHGQ